MGTNQLIATALTADGKWLLQVDASGKATRLRLEPNQSPENVGRTWTNVNSIIFSKGARQMAVGDRNGRIHVGQPAENGQWTLLSEKEERWLPIKFDEEGENLIAIHWDRRSAAVFDIATAKILKRWNFATNQIPYSYVLQSGKHILARLTPERVQLIDPLTGVVSADFRANADGTGGMGNSFALSPDGSLLAIGSEYGTTTLWSTVDGRKVDVLRGHLKGVHSVAFSPDGKRLLTLSGEEEAVKVWDAVSRQEVATLPGKGSLFTATSFSDDGSTIASFNWRNELHVWRAPSFGEIEAAERAKVDAVAR